MPTSSATLKGPVLERVMRASWLADMPGAIAAEALAMARERSFAPGERVFARGEPGNGIYTLVRGAVRFSRATADGRASMIALLEPVTWFGELSAFDGLPRTHDAHAVGTTLVFHHRQEDFEHLLERHPELYARFVRLLSLRMRLVYDWLEEAAVTPFPVRLARRLLALSQFGPNAAQDSDGREVPLTQEELGQLLGKSRQSVSKLLAVWEAEGLVRSAYGRVVVVNAPALYALGGGPGPALSWGEGRIRHGTAKGEKRPPRSRVTRVPR